MRKLLYLLLVMLLLAGCAEEVVKKEITPEEMTVRIYFRGNVDSSLYKYYFIFATSSGIKLPNVNIANALILEPGEDYDPADIAAFTHDFDPTDNIKYYYENYFSTWRDSTRFKLGQFNIVVPQGYYPTSANRTTHDTYNDNIAWSVQNNSSGTLLKMTFSIDQISSGTLTKEDNERIYFNFLTADYKLPGTKGGLFYDCLDSEPSIQNKAGAQVSEYDSSNDEKKPAGADIIRWTVDIK